MVFEVAVSGKVRNEKEIYGVIFTFFVLITTEIFTFYFITD